MKVSRFLFLPFLRPRKMPKVNKMKQVEGKSWKFLFPFLLILPFERKFISLSCPCWEKRGRRFLAFCFVIKSVEPFSVPHPTHPRREVFLVVLVRERSFSILSLSLGNFFLIHKNSEWIQEFNKWLVPLSFDFPIPQPSEKFSSWKNLCSCYFRFQHRQIYRFFSFFLFFFFRVYARARFHW